MASEPKQKEETETHWLTTISWNSMPEYGGSGSLETGIHTKDGSVPFRLIQHGWYSAENAHDFIKKALNKGWDSNKISKVMDFIKERR